MKIPFFGNDRLFNFLKKDWLDVVEKVGKTGVYLNGPQTEECEIQLATRSNRKYAVLCSSGTDALMSAGEYFKLSHFLVSNYSFLASASALFRTGSKPQFVDIDPIAFSPTPLQYEKEKKRDTQGIVHVEISGSCTHHHAIEQYAKEQKLVLIEDAAQSFGAYCEKRPSGQFGDVSTLSFDPTKILPGSSPAGCLLTDNEELYQFCKQRRLHGRSDSGEFLFAGVKSLISETEAALLLLKLRYLDQWITRRNHIAHFYSTELKDLPLIVPETQLPYEAELKYPRHTFHKFILKVQTDHRNSLQNHLKDHGIETRQYYTRCLSEELLFKGLGKINTPEASDLTRQSLALPIFPELTDEECQMIVKLIKQFYSNKDQ